MPHARETLEVLRSAVNERDAARAAACFARDGSYREARHHAIRGRDRIEAHFRRFFEGGRAFRFDVDSIIEEGDRCALAYRFATVDAGGRTTEHEGVAVVTLAAGSITSWREYEGS